MPAEHVLVRRVEPDDWPLLRALRLEALADFPIGFLELLVDARDLPDSEWQFRAARGSVGGDSVQVLALHGARPVATAVGFVRDGSGWLAAVYVSPAHRGRGLLGELVDRVAAWAVEQGETELRLEVHEDNPRAQRAYARLGFSPTGARHPYGPDPSRDELLMVRTLP